MIQRLGKFNRIARPGFKLRIPIIESVASKENLKIQQLDVDVETKTNDVFCHPKDFSTIPYYQQ